MRKHSIYTHIFLQCTHRPILIIGKYMFVSCVDMLEEENKNDFKNVCC